MPESEAHQWYTNKELFEQLGSLKGEFTDLRSDMKETRALIKQYNGLREEIGQVREENEEIRKQLQSIIDEEEGKNQFLESFRQWGGWLFALLTLVILIFTTFN